jgi:hypothetical protein
LPDAYHLVEDFTAITSCECEVAHSSRREERFIWSKRKFSSMPEALASLTKKLGLLQAVGKDAAQQWAHRTRELQAPLSAKDLDFFDGIHLLDQAAIKAASEKFPAEFKATSYDYGPPPIAEVLVAIEAL